MSVAGAASMTIPDGVADGSRSEAFEVSVLAPAYNEEGNLQPLHQRLVEALEPLDRSFEIVYVDDGSTDGTFAELTGIAEADPRARVVQLRRNFGKTAAINAGIDHCGGKVLVFIDADLQNDPADIPRLLALIDEGYDVASGWRKDRKDAALSRTFPSRIANYLISKVTGVHLHDYGCMLKAYRADLLGRITLYGEMHRFIPAYLALIGARIAELPVNHAPRIRGKSKYGLMRTFNVVLDLLTVKFLGSFASKPIYAFGGLGMVAIALSFVIGLGAIWRKLMLGLPLLDVRLLLLGGLLFAMGFQALLLGLLSELVIRARQESRGAPSYVVRRLLNA